MDDNWEYPYFRTFRTPPYSYESTLQDLGSAMIQKVLDMICYCTPTLGMTTIHLRVSKKNAKWAKSKRFHVH